MQTFNIVEGSKGTAGQNGEARFAGEFALNVAPPHEMTAEEITYIHDLSRVMDRIYFLSKNEPSGSDEQSQALAKAIDENRRILIEELRKDAVLFTQSKLSPLRAADKAFFGTGAFEAYVKRLSEALFVIQPKYDSENKICDIVIRTADSSSFVPDPKEKEKQSLYVELTKARMVVNAVAKGLEDRGDTTRARLVRHVYLGKLADIAQMGLQQPHVELGKLSLQGLREEFVAMEAGRIKNEYVRNLGVSSLFAAVFFFFLYFYVTGIGRPQFLVDHNIFLIAAGGASVGTWLSFSIRRVALGFEDLAILEEDLLDPSLRVIFVVLLTIVVCLLFWTEALNLEIGMLKTSGLIGGDRNLKIGAIGLVVGLFCGIAERSLATAISGRAVAFVKSVGA